jgi:hypothetical protein
MARCRAGSRKNNTRKNRLTETQPALTAFKHFLSQKIIIKKNKIISLLFVPPE